MKVNKRFKKRFFWSIAHGIFMILLVLLWMRQPFIFKYEYNTTENLLSFKDFKGFTENSVRNKYINQFFFINTAHSFIIDDEASETGKLNVRTDRQQILELLKILNKNPDVFEILFLDVFIPEIKSESDKELILVVEKLKEKNKIVTANIIVDDFIDPNKEALQNDKAPRIVKQMKSSLKYQRENHPNIFGEHLSGPLYYPLSMNDAFYKFHHSVKINKDYIKQAPLLLKEIKEGKKAKKPFFWNTLYFYEDDFSLYQNIDIPEMILSSNDLYDMNMNSTFQNTGNLDTWIELDGEILLDKLRSEPGKIIVIGDMALGDIHYTLAGRTEGPLIVANTLISLIEGHNKLSYPYLLYLIFSFGLVSYLTFYPEVLSNLKEKQFRNRAINFFYHYLVDKSKYLVLFFATLIGLYVFKHYMFLLFTLFYIYVVGLIIREYKRAD